MDLYVVKKSTESSYVEGTFEIYRGYYGPVPLAEAKRFQNILAGDIQGIGSMREVLLLLGVIAPENEGDVEVIQAAINRLLDALEDEDEGDHFAPPENDLAPAENSAPPAPEENIENSALPENLDDVVVPEDFEAPDYASMKDAVKDFDYRARYGVTKPKLSTEEMRKVYYVYVSENA